VKERIYDLAMMEELERHGYKISAGTLYPLLHGLEEKGYWLPPSAHLQLECNIQAFGAIWVELGE
jgi:hypothetical protein